MPIFDSTTYAGSGSLPRAALTRSTAVVPIGDSRILCADPATGACSVWSIARRLGAAPAVALAEGNSPDLRADAVCWAGGESLVLLKSGQFAALGFTMKRPGVIEFSSSKRLRSDLSIEPSDIIYLGRGRFLVWNQQNYATLRVSTARGRLEVVEMVHSPAALEGVDFAWAGGDRVLGLNAASGGIVSMRYERRLTTQRPGRRFRAFAPSRFAPPYWLPARPEPVPAAAAYLGANRICLLERTGEYQIHDVPIPTKIVPAIEDYLELNTNVREAIRWPDAQQEIRYRDWDLHAATRGFYAKLARFDGNYRAGNRAAFTFLGETDPHTQQPRIAPETNQNVISTRDASEVFLAHVAHSLLVERLAMTSWRLHDYSATDLATLLDAALMYEYVPAASGSAAGYRVIQDGNGMGTPTDPNICLRFLLGTDANYRTGPSLLVPNRRETLANLFRWMLDHLYHGLVTGGPTGVQCYGYYGFAPIEKMLTRILNPQDNSPNPKPRYWAWAGCHTAGALLAWTLRSANLPARAPRTYIEDSNDPSHAHIGFDCACAKAFCGHTDDFYANGKFQDEHINPLLICDIDAEYASRRQLWLSQVATGEERRKAYDQSVARKSLLAPTYYWVEMYLSGAGVFEYYFNLEDFPASEASSLKQQALAKIQQAIADFKAASGLTGAPDTQVHQAYKDAHQAWLDSR